MERKPSRSEQAAEKLLTLLAPLFCAVHITFPSGTEVEVRDKSGNRSSSTEHGLKNTEVHVPTGNTTDINWSVGGRTGKMEVVDWRPKSNNRGGDAWINFPEYGREESVHILPDDPDEYTLESFPTITARHDLSDMK